MIKNIKNMLLKITAVTCLTSLSIFSGIMLENREVKAKDVTAPSLFEISSGTITQNEKLPDYMKEIVWKGKTYKNNEVNAVKIQTDGKSKSCKIKYNRVIDLSESRKDINLVDFIVASKNTLPYSNDVLTEGITNTYDVRYFDIKLTDIHNRDNFITINFERDMQFTYRMPMRVTTQNQKSAGWYAPSERLNQSPFGSMVMSSFVGAPYKEKYNVVSSFFDASEKTVYGYPDLNLNKTVIRDLDNPDHLLKGDNLWQGFTTGEVELTLELNTISEGKSATIYLFGVNGQDFTGEKIVDNTPPEIRIRDKNIEKVIPLGEAQSKYKIFKANAYDLFDGAISEDKISAKVFYDYGKESQSEIAVNNGYFTPLRGGKYTIEYRVYDSSNNEGVKTINVDISEKLKDIIIETDYNISDIYVGSVVKMPENIGLKGGSEVYNSEIYVEKHEDNLKIIPENGNVKLEKQGYYSVVIKATDYIGKECYKKFTFKVAERPCPLVYMPAMPKVLPAGTTYVFPDFEADDYNSFMGSKVEANKHYLVSTDNFITEKTYYAGDTIKLDEGILSYKVCANDKANSKNVYQSEKRIIKVVKMPSIGSYFYSDDGNIALDYSDPQHPTYVTDKNSTMVFANRLGMIPFNIDYIIPEGKANFDEMTWHFTDGARENLKAEVTLKKKTLKVCNVFLNGKFVFELNSGITDNSEFYVEVKDGKLYINYAYICDLTSESGEEMFKSGYGYFSFSFNGVYGKSAITLYEINNQSYLGLFDDGEEFDITPPKVMLEKEISKVYNIGDVITIPKAIATDVLDYNSKISVVVKKGKEVIYQNSNIEESFSFVANSSAYYNITYTATDGKDNFTNEVFIVRVYNSIKPTLHVNGHPETKVNVGEEVMLPTADASDFKGKKLDVKVYIANPKGEVREAKSSFKPQEKGIYMVRYTCIDEDMLRTVREYKVVAQ